MMIKLVVFDLDGVLVDSLTSHLQFCEDKIKEYELKIKIPTPQEFKEKIVRQGIKVSPMYYFFTALGFSDHDAEKADIEYGKKFAEEYPSKFYPGIHRLISDLRASLKTPKSEFWCQQFQWFTNAKFRNAPVFRGALKKFGIDPRDCNIK